MFFSITVRYDNSNWNMVKIILISVVQVRHTLMRSLTERIKFTTNPYVEIKEIVFQSAPVDMTLIDMDLSLEMWRN